MKDAVSLVGKKLVKRFLIEKEVGRGRHTIVYKAHDLKTKQAAAVQVPLDEIGADALVHEGALWAKLDNPHIAAFLDQGVNSKGMHFLAWVWQEGPTLRDHLRENPPGLRTAVDIVLQAARGLAALHEQGFVHREFHPGKIYLTGDIAHPRVRLVDLGMPDKVRFNSITEAAACSSNPNFIAPESASENPFNPSIDSYSLAATLYQAVTGYKAHPGNTLWELVGRIRFQDPLSPKNHNPEISPHLESLIMRGLSKNPEQRPVNAAAFAEEMERLLSLDLIEDKQSPTMAVPDEEPRERDERVAAVLFYERVLKDEPDPEDYEQFLLRIERIARDYEGRLDSVSGFALRLVFGAERTHGDETARALRSGLRIMEEFGGKAAQVLTKLGDISNHFNPPEDFALIDERAGILVDDEVARRAIGEFNVLRENDRFLITGHAEWSSVFDRPLEGRVEELSRLCELLSDASEEARAAVIVAEEGMGKSRLMRELYQVGSRKKYRITAISALSEFIGRPYSLIADLLKHRVRITKHTDLSREEKTICLGNVEAQVMEIIFDHEKSGLLKAGIDAKAVKWQIWEAVAGLIQSDVDKGPVLWLIDDFYRADPVSRDLILWLSRTLLGPFRLIVSTLPSEWPPVSQEVRSLDEIISVELPPFSPGLADTFIRNLEPDMPHSILEAVMQRSGGNPLFMEELVFAYRNPTSGPGVTQNIQATIQAALDRVSDPAAAVALAASVLGESGTALSLEAVAPPHQITAVSKELVGARIWEDMPVQHGEAPERYCFKHRLVRDALVELLPKDKRREYELAAARYFDEGGHRDPLRAAAFYRGARDKIGAVRCFLEAATMAHAAADAESTLRITTDLLGMKIRGDGKRQTLLLRAEARVWTGRLKQGLDDAVKLLEDEDADPSQRAQAACLACHMLRRLSRGKKAIEMADIAIKQARDTLNDELLGRALFHAAFANYDSCDADGIEACLKEAAGLDRTNSLIESYHAEIAHLDAGVRGDLERCYATSKEALQINTRIGNKSRIGANTANTGLALYYLGRYREALPYLQEAANIYRRQGNQLHVYDAMINEARILGEMEHWQDALSLLREAYQGLEGAGEHHFRGLALALMARIYCRRNRGEDRVKALGILDKHLDPEKHTMLHALEQANAAMEVYLTYNMGGAAIPFAEQVLKRLAKLMDQCENASEALAYAALVLHDTDHDLRHTARVRARARIQNHLDLCTETENRRSVRQIRAHKVFLERVGEALD